jgi:hypothetical protein
MNEFPKRSKASISKQTNHHILKAFNKIKEITHEIMETQVRKVQNCRSSSGCFFGTVADVFSVNSNQKFSLSAVQTSVPEVCTKFYMKDKDKAYGKL